VRGEGHSYASPRLRFHHHLKKNAKIYLEEASAEEHGKQNQHDYGCAQDEIEELECRSVYLTTIPDVPIPDLVEVLSEYHIVINIEGSHIVGIEIPVSAFQLPLSVYRVFSNPRVLQICLRITALKLKHVILSLIGSLMDA
jgi:hypothetical protein